MFVPLEYFTTRIRSETISSCSAAVHVQRSLISRLVFDKVTADAYTSLLRSLSIMVRRFVKDPSDQAVDALWGEMLTWNTFNRSFNGKSSSDQRMALAYSSWVELSAQWSSKRDMVVDFGPYTVAEWRNPHPHCLYVGFDTEQFAGVRFGFSSLYGDSADAGGPLAFYMDAPGGHPGTATTLSSWRLVPSTGERLEPAVEEQPYTPSARPYYGVQLGIRELAQRQPGGAASVAAERAWSEVYSFLDSDIGITWTAPVALCGNYSCFEGVVAADITLRHVSLDCYTQWLELRGLLAAQRYSFLVGEQNSSIFIVNHVSRRFPWQQGLLVGASHEAQAMPAGNLTQAGASPQAVVRATARAILGRFGAWDSAALRQQHLFTYRPSGMKRQPPALLECEPGSTGEGLDADCLQVGTLSVALDEQTRWLLVATFPVGAFGMRAAVLAQAVDSKVDKIRSMSQLRVDEARATGLAIFFGMTVLSVACGFGLGVLVSRPLQRLSKLMLRLGDLDFAHESKEFGELRSGRRSRIRDVGKLQGTFCSLSRGIETFARFVPETVVRNIVRGNPHSTQLHVSRREVTIMFSDIRDFTRIAEDLTQRDLLFVLTRYLSVMTRIVELFEGVVAEILGDGLLVFWNAPDDVKDHAAKACAAALAQQQSLILLNAEFARLGLPQLAVRIGLHTGPVLSGNVGSDTKMKFGCLGDPVHLAGRLEGLCKLYGVGIICSAATHDALPRSAGFFCRRLDLVQVKEKPEPTAIYEVVGRELAPGPAQGPASTGEPPGGPGDVESGHPGAAPEACAGWRRARLLRPVLRLAGGRARKDEGESPQAEACVSRTSTLTSADAASAAVAAPCHLRADATEFTATAQSKDVVTCEQRGHAELYEAALTAFQEARFLEAHELAARSLADDPSDVAAERLLDRTRTYMQRDGAAIVLTEAERAAWTGVFLVE